MKNFVTFLIIVLVFFKANAQKSTEYNKRFNNRFEYVTSFFDYVTFYDEDFLLSLNVVKKDNSQLTFVVVGIKELFEILHGESYDSKDQLYFSVGKIFLRDTLYTDSSKYEILKKFSVDKDSLNYFNNQSFAEVVSKYTIDGHLINVDSKRERALIFYFDRRFYPTRDPDNEGYVVDLKYDFTSANNNSIFRGKKRFIQFWDRNGNLISEFPQE